MKTEAARTRTVAMRAALNFPIPSCTVQLRFAQLLQRCNDLHGSIVPLIGGRGTIVDIDQSIGGRWCGGGLDPIGIANLRVYALMHDHLPADRRSGNRFVPIVAYRENPVAGRHAWQINVRSTARSTRLVYDAGTGSIGESDYCKRSMIRCTHTWLGGSGYGLRRIRGVRHPDLCCSRLMVASFHQRPSQP